MQLWFYINPFFWQRQAYHSESLEHPLQVLGSFGSYGTTTWACGTFLGSFVNSAYMLCTRNLPLTYHNPETHQPYLGPTLTILSTRPYVLDDSWIFGLTTREPADEVRVRRTLRHVDHTVSLVVYTWIDYGFRSWHERRVFSVVSERGEFLLAILTVSTNDLEGWNNVLMLANADVSETLPPSFASVSPPNGPGYRLVEASEFLHDPLSSTKLMQNDSGVMLGDAQMQIRVTLTIMSSGLVISWTLPPIIRMSLVPNQAKTRIVLPSIRRAYYSLTGTSIWLGTWQ